MPATLAPFDSTHVRLKELFNPCRGVYPAAKVLRDEYTTAAQSFTVLETSMWNATGRFNTQGQQWEAVNFWSPAAGSKNVTTDRAVLGVTPSHIQEFEFLINDDKLDIMLATSGAFDMQVYVTDETGNTYKLQDRPLGTTASGYTFRNIQFADRNPRRVRVVLGGAAYFIQVNHEARAVIRPAPDRPLLGTDGDSYFESIHAQNAGSDETYFTFGPIDAIFEATGFAPARHAQGGSGLFNNGTQPPTSPVTTDAAGPAGTTRWGSSQRISKATPTLQSKPVAYLFNGTINDGPPASPGKVAYKNRLYQVWEAINAVDPGCPIIHVGPEPYNNSITAGSAHDLHRQAIKECGKNYGQFAGFIDPSGDLTNPWWTGTGFDNSPTNSEQAALTGHDGIHGNYRGYKWYGSLIALYLGEITIPAVRARGIA